MSEPTPPVTYSTIEYLRPAPTYAPRQPRQRYWLHALLLLATCFTTLVVGAHMQHNFALGRPAFLLDYGSGSLFQLPWALQHPARLLLGIPFAGTLMLILLAHEMGHYLYCKRYGVWATLPFFIPAPTLIGTFGAFIRIRSPIRSRTALFDIGIAGPIAGFAVAVGVLAVSLGLSKPIPIGSPPPDLELGLPLIFDLMHRLLAYAATGQGVAGLPLNRVLLHPMAIAAWVGMFATALNLLPGGQLDGGHIVFSIAPRAHRWISWVTTIALLFMAYYLCYVWLMWAILLRLSSLRHPQVAEWPRVAGSRAALAGFAILMLVLTLAPAPFLHFSLREVLQEMRGR
ncbi:MAG: site-2 protease family protein [Candidatus Sulfotelmatobacter sp.]|jgi:membrane-associated protease RseP (regulator of RpoE activity)